VVQVRELRHEVSVVAWNPAIDLVALGTPAGRTLSCLRPLSWEKVWEIGPFPEGQGPTACCWRPDGRALAYGDEKGQVHILSAEDGTALCVSWHPPHVGPVRSLDWGGERWADESFAVGNPLFEADALVRMFGPDGAHDYDDRVPQMFPKLLLEAVGTGPTAVRQVAEGAPAVSTAGGVSDKVGDGGQANESEAEARRRWAPAKGMRLFWDACPSTASVLVSGGEDGHVGMSMFGVYAVARVDVRKRLAVPSSSPHSSNAAVTVEAVKLAQSLACVSCGIADRGAGKRWLAPVRMDALRVREKELACGTHMALRGRTLAGYLAFHARQATALVELVHEELNKVLVAPLAVLAEDHGDYAPGAGPGSGTWAHVCGLLGALCVVGAMPMSVRTFLTTASQEDKVKRLGRKLTQHLADLQGVLLNRLQPAAEALLFQMSELSDFAYYAQGLDELDVEPEGKSLCDGRERVLRGALEEATLLVQTIDRIQALTTRSAQRTTNFVRWLARTSALANAEEGIAHEQPKLAQPAGEPAADHAKVMEFLDDTAHGGPLADIGAHFRGLSIEQLEENVAPKLGLVQDQGKSAVEVQRGVDAPDSPISFFPPSDLAEGAKFGDLLMGATGRLHGMANWVIGTLMSAEACGADKALATGDALKSVLMTADAMECMGLCLQNVALRDLESAETPTWEGAHLFPELERPLDAEVAETLDNARRQARFKGPHFSIAAAQVSADTCCVVQYNVDDPGSRPSWCAIKIPEGHKLLGLQLYKPGLLALSYQSSNAAADAENPTSTLLTVRYGDIEFVPLPTGVGGESFPALAVLARDLDAADPAEICENTRELAVKVVGFHTGPERGMASVLSDEGFQIHILDMEDEEDSDGEDGEVE